ncbi:MAG: DUF3048 domain-containing protein [Microbacteriaceae bacterium]
MQKNFRRTTAAVAAAIALVAGVATASPAVSAPSVVSGESGVVAVKVPANQKGAYPLHGLKAAAIIYVEPVERGFTRHIALYGTDKVPAKVGPVRSLRETDFHVLDQFGKVRIYSSGHTMSRDIMKNFLATTSHVIRTSDDGAEEIYKSKKCVDPFCNFLKGTTVPGRNTGLSATNTKILAEAGLVKGVIPAAIKKKGKAVKVITIQYKKTPFSQLIPRTITWDSKKKVWVYAASGRSATIDKVGTKTVAGKTSSATALIQFSSAKNAGNAFVCRSMPNGGPDAVPYTNSVGKGKGLLLRDGKMYNITWSRSSSTETISYKFSNGSKVKVAGQPWVFLVPANLTKTTIKYASGKKSTYVAAAPTPRWSFSTSVLKERKLCDAPVSVSVVKSTKKKTTTIKVRTKFDSLTWVNLKGAKVVVQIKGKGFVKKTISKKTGQLVITGDPTKVISVKFASQAISAQHYAEGSWKKK